MSHYEVLRQPTVSFHLAADGNSSPRLPLPRQQQNKMTEFETTITYLPESQRTTPVDWKQRCENIQFHHQLELERTRLHYENQLQQKITEMRMQLEREYEDRFANARSPAFGRHSSHNRSSSSLGLDRSVGEQVREQLRLAHEYDRDEDERRQSLLRRSTDSDELKGLVSRLHTEGTQVLSLSELLTLQMSGVDIGTADGSSSALKKLYEENASLRSLIASMRANDNGSKLINGVSDTFRCEQERRLIEARHHPKFDQLEQEIHHMTRYQRDALEKLFALDRLSLINELDQAKEQSRYLQQRLDQFKRQSEPSSHGVTNSVHAKFMRCDHHRQALIYQKRYLLVLLSGYEDTETYALNEIRRLTGETQSTSNRTKSFPKQSHHRRQFDYRFRFRCYVRVAVAMIRMRHLVKRWTQKLTAIQ